MKRDTGPRYVLIDATPDDTIDGTDEDYLVHLARSDRGMATTQIAHQYGFIYRRLLGDVTITRTSPHNGHTYHLVKQARTYYLYRQL